MGEEGSATRVASSGDGETSRAEVVATASATLSSATRASARVVVHLLLPGSDVRCATARSQFVIFPKMLEQYLAADVDAMGASDLSEFNRIVATPQTP